MKKYLFSLFVGLIGLTSFCNAGILTTSETSISLINGGTTVVKSYDITSGSILCVTLNSSTNFSCTDSYGNSIGAGPYSCYTNDTVDFTCINGSTSYRRLQFFSVDISSLTQGGSCPECPTCDPQYTSDECQSVYGLVSSGSLSQCNNDLLNCESSLSGYQTSLSNCSTNLNVCNTSLSNCLQSNCSNNSGLSWSALYINNIQHIGAGIINIDIPEEISRDYINDTENDTFELNVEGYNVDTAYIENIIDVQNYQPTTDDLTKLFTMFGSFGGLLVACLFVILIFYLIKKSFK